MLKSIGLKNFKSARNFDTPIPLRALTVLSGLNGSGKSTVLQAIALLRQSLDIEGATDTTLDTLHLHGPLVQLGNSNDVLNERAENDSIEINISTSEHLNSWVFISRINSFNSNESILERDPMIPSTKSAILKWEPNPTKNPTEKYIKTCEFQFLQADRLTPSTHYERSFAAKNSRYFLGVRGQYTPDFLAEHGTSLDVRPGRICPSIAPGVEAELIKRIAATPKLYDQISGWLQHLSPGVRLDAERIRQTDLVTLGFSYNSTQLAQDSERRRPTNVGFGLTYCLPIVTACLSAPPGALLLLENPEAHLHPRGQAALGTLLAKCAADGVQILVETHSDHVLNGIRLAVKHQTIANTDVSLCHFVRDTDTGDSYIQNPMILPDGELSAWPKGFFDEWEISLEELLR